VIVYEVAALAAVGVPLITPVLVSRLRPAGSAGDTAQLVTVPVTVGVRVATVPTTREVVPE
jgi:hypothetical protein